MFRCDNCGGQQPKGEKTSLVVTDKRSREYRDKDNRLIATGWEIVSEERRCSACLLRLNGGPNGSQA